jgi:hypothetical protein
MLYYGTVNFSLVQNLRARLVAYLKSIEFNKPLNKNATKIEAIDCDEPTSSNPVVIIFDTHKKYYNLDPGCVFKRPVSQKPC